MKMLRLPAYHAITYLCPVTAKDRSKKMSRNSLQDFVEKVGAEWGPLTSDLVARCRAGLEDLLETPATEKWLKELQDDLPESRELHRNPVHGFMLLAHTESQGRFRAPHDHGRGWVIYAVQQGEMEVRTYVRICDPDGTVRLVQRKSCLVRPGQAKVYLPGDIHDTRCTAGPVLYYRFTDRDLKKEEREGHGMTRYVDRQGIWTVQPGDAQAAVSAPVRPTSAAIGL